MGARVHFVFKDVEDEAHELGVARENSVPTSKRVNAVQQRQDFRSGNK